MQENASRQIVAALDGWRDMSEALAERTFLAVYGSPTLQAAVGIDPAGTQPLRKAAKSPLHRELLRKRIAELKSRIPVGGLREAVDPRAALCRHDARLRSTSVASRPCAAFAKLMATCPCRPSRRSCASNSTCC